MARIAPTPEFTESARRACRHLAELALAEDLGSARASGRRDITSAAIVPPDAAGQARFVSRSDGVLCGVEACREVVELVDSELQFSPVVADGNAIRAGQAIAELRGKAASILLAERTCLNFLGRLSGIATLTARHVARIQGTNAAVFDTRKTLPGWRLLEKYAVACGGGRNHRMGLYDAVLIKDNHLAFMDAHIEQPLGEVGLAVHRARQWIADNARLLPNGDNTVVQIEVDNLRQLDAALAAGPDIVLLDNMDVPTLERAVQRRNATARRVLLEASGGISLETIGAVARCGVDRISVGALTHSAVNLDIGLDWSSE
jgi:nicotinate-nucleotide pyrophosphorylase (carboxylating)